MLWRHARQDAEQALEAEFQYQVRNVVDQIESSLKSNVQILRGVAGLFEASEGVTREEFRRYVEALRLGEHYPGIQGVGFTLVVPPDRKASHETAIQREGFPDYAIRPGGPRELYTSIIYLEPFSGRNLRAFGYDMFSEPVRQTAMARARDEGEAAMSGKVRLVQETETDVQPGFLIYVPVYQNGLPHDTVEDRRPNLVGWAYSPLRMHDLMRGVLGLSQLDEMRSVMDMKVYDGLHLSPDALMFALHPASATDDSPPPVFRAVRRLLFAGHPWSVQVTSTPRFEAGLRSEKARLVAVTGSAGSVLLALFIRMLASRQVRLAAAVEETARINRQLAASEARFRGYFDLPLIGIAMTSLDKGWIEVNDRMCEILGYSREALRQKTWADLTHPDDLAANLARFEQALAGETSSYSLEKRFVRPDGRIVPAQLSVTCVRDAGGRPDYFVSLVQDITLEWEARRVLAEYRARLEAEVAARTAELRESESRYRAILDAMPDLLFVFDCNGVYLQIHTADPGNLTQPAEDTLGRRIEDTLPPDLAGVVCEKLRRAFADGNMQLLEYMLDIGGETRYFEGRIIAYTPDRALAVVRNITERRRAEAELRHSRDQLQFANLELAKAARMKDEFLASMSHELRTPLTGILGLTEVLGEEVYGPVSEAQRQPLNMIQESGRHLLALINDILDLAKIEAGQIQLDLMPCQLAEIGQASLNLVKGMAGKKQQRIEFAVAPSELVVQADGRRLKQMLVNLLSNAVKFTPKGGRIGLQIAGDPEAGVVRLAVWDTGIGITPEDLPRLFQTFVQLDARLERQYEGTGLGLALVKRMAELHGGTVGVESEPGRGSRFILTLPWNPAAPVAIVPASAEPKPVPPPATAAGTQPALILLAEDNEPNRVTYAEYLQARGYRVAEAGDGMEAIEKARALKPALVLMDIQMPGISGLDAIQRLRADPDPAVARAPIIALTALVMPGDRERCLAAGANEYLSKPVGMKDLLATIAAQLGAS